MKKASTDKFKTQYSYYSAHWLYGRVLGIITLIAFFFWYQADALISEQGLSPWTNDLANIEKWCTKS